MSIRYKTILVFLATALIPFLAIGALVFVDFQTSLRNNAFRHLETVTGLQESRVNDLLGFYAQAATYLSEQPTLRQAVSQSLDKPNDPKAKAALQQVLAGIIGSSDRVASLQEVAVTDVDGKVLESSNPTAGVTSLPVKSQALLSDAYQDDQGTHLRFGVPMQLGNDVRARFYLTVGGEALFAVAGARNGLGETGETFLVKRVDDKTGVFVTPLRFDAMAAFSREVPLTDVSRPSAQALLKRQQTFTEGVVNYRGRPVIAVTKYIPQADLGIVGQIDQAEVFEPIKRLTIEVVIFAVLLILFTIFVGAFMAQLFVRPIESLAVAAAKLRHGDFDARTKVMSNDEIGQLARTFNAMADDLAKQDQTKADIIALISHQLRTPVTAVKGLISLSMKEVAAKLSPEKTKLLRLAAEENEKLNKLITQILEAAHADAGKLVLTKKATDLGALIKAVAADHRSTLEVRQQNMRLLLAPDTVKAAVDPDKLQFALGNLLSNASKYSPPGGVITIELSQTKHYSWIRITDSGGGISEVDQQKLFKRFSRIPNRNGETPEGLGLGLYMAKKIVDLHKGNLTVDSGKNHGSSFTIELPTNA